MMNHSSEPIGSPGNFMNFKRRQGRGYRDFDVSHRVQFFAITNDQSSITYCFRPPGTIGR